MYHVLTHIKNCVFILYIHICAYIYICIMCVCPYIYTWFEPYGFEPQDCFEILILLPSVPECRNL